MPLVAVSLLLAALIGRSLDLNQRQSSSYVAGHRALASGDFVAAASQFAAAGNYADAPILLAETRAALEPYALAYEAGAAALAAGDFERAIATLLPVAVALPGYADVSLLVEQARIALEAQEFDAAASAIAAGDWLNAEVILSHIAFGDPENAEVTALLAELRGAHPVYLHTSTRALTVTALSGEAPVVINESPPAAWPIWSPDRSRIAFVTPGDASNGYVRALFVINPDGSGLRQLAEGPARWRAPVWSPDGRHIAFEVDGPTAENLSGRPTIMVANADTGVVHDVIAGAFDNAGSPSWSPTGDRLAFVVRSAITVSADFAYSGRDPLNHGDEVMIKNMTTGRISRASSPDLAHPWRIAWSPGAEQIVVYSRADGTSYSQGMISLLDVTTGESTAIDMTTMDVSMPVWAPDGQSFAYVANNRVLQIVHLGGQTRSLTPGETMAEFITWSPTSDKVLVSGGGIAGSYLFDLAVAEPAITPVQVTFDGGGGDPGPPQWSPVNPSAAQVALDPYGTALDR